jgi:hypothetical protein
MLKTFLKLIPKWWHLLHVFWSLIKWLEDWQQQSEANHCQISKQRSLVLTKRHRGPRSGHLRRWDWQLLLNLFSKHNNQHVWLYLSQYKEGLLGKTMTGSVTICCFLILADTGTIDCTFSRWLSSSHISKTTHCLHQNFGLTPST